MSGMSSPIPTVATPYDKPGLADTVMSLLAFVQSPEYPERVKELLAAEAAAKAAAAAAEESKAAALDAVSRHTVASMDLQLKSQQFEERQALIAAAHSEREAILAAREADVSSREKSVTGSAELRQASLDKYSAELTRRQESLDRQQRELAMSHSAVEAQAADLARRLAKLREAGL
jgi:hypothetical protein